MVRRAFEPSERTPVQVPQFGDQSIPVPTGADDSFSTACFMSSVVLLDADQSAKARRSDFALGPQVSIGGKATFRCLFF